jgi:hypothetical protein
MPESDYPGRAILVGFFIQKQEAGSVAQRDQFSQELFDKFNDHIVAACRQATPPVDPSPRVRASLAVMAQNAPGGSNAAKARRAVQAYLTFRGF